MSKTCFLIEYNFTYKRKEGEIMHKERKIDNTLLKDYPELRGLINSEQFRVYDKQGRERVTCTQCSFAKLSQYEEEAYCTKTHKFKKAKYVKVCKHFKRAY